MNAGIVAAAVYNVHKSKGARVKASDFVPKPPRRLTPEQAAEHFRSLARSHNIRISA